MVFGYVRLLGDQTNSDLTTIWWTKQILNLKVQQKGG